MDFDIPNEEVFLQERRALEKMYYQAMQLYRRASMEILLEPLNPASQDPIERRTIELSYCIPKFDEYLELDLGLLSSSELCEKVAKVQDYKAMLDSAFDFVDERFMGRFKVTYLGLIEEDLDDDEDFSEYEEESEYETESELDEDMLENDSDWEDEWESDSGNESVLEPDNDEPPAEPVAGNWMMDSGVDTDSEIDH